MTAAKKCEKQKRRPTWSDLSRDLQPWSLHHIDVHHDRQRLCFHTHVSWFRSKQHNQVDQLVQSNADILLSLCQKRNLKKNTGNHFVMTVINLEKKTRTDFRIHFLVLFCFVPPLLVGSLGCDPDESVSMLTYQNFCTLLSIYHGTCV